MAKIRGITIYLFVEKNRSGIHISTSDGRIEPKFETLVINGKQALPKVFENL